MTLGGTLLAGFATYCRATPDSLYTAVHPRLLFDSSEVPSLYNKVRDGGYDDDAYGFIRLVVDYIYPGQTELQTLDDDFGLFAVPALGLATFLENPPDEAARTMGRDVSLYLANNYAPDFDDFNTALRLRSLALGYDLFFANATEPERITMRDEMVSYLDFILNDQVYENLSHRPYLSNRGAMVAAAVGLAAVCLADETDPARVTSSLAFADNFLSEWLAYLVDNEGTYNEGVLYAAWSLRHLVYYFVARKKYDGFSYGDDARVRKLERWFAYELLPSGNGKTNNLNDSGWNDDPLPRHHTYFDWAQSEWDSGLSAWLYEHVAGPYGWDWGLKADKAATVLWNRNLAPQQPDSVLPHSHLWENRGLFYYRTGWPSSGSSDDVVFSFYSGKFQGGHAQEDQNQFTLRAYGTDLVIDHGLGGLGTQSGSHNLVFIDGAGQHNAGGSIGTDGKIDAFLLAGFADYLRGNATAAYTTYSPLNNHGYPFPWSDWSWGYGGANPVDFALRDVLCVHLEGSVLPYFLILDNIQKDGGPHTYEWRLHTSDNNSVDVTTNPIRVSSPGADMEIHLLHPEFAAVGATTSPYNNLSPEPDSKIINLATTAIDPRFAVLLLPRAAASAAPTVTTTRPPWGVTAEIAWPDRTDVIVVNYGGIPVAFTTALGPTVQTDGSAALLRFSGSVLERYLVTGAQTLTVAGVPWVKINNGPANIALSGTAIHLDRYDADFVLYGPGVTDIQYRGQAIHFVTNNDTLTPDPVSAVAAGGPPRGLRAIVYPNPFNPSTTIAFETDAPGRVRAVVYDALGGRVRILVDAHFPAGPHALSWDGTNKAGNVVASGVYFLKLSWRGRVFATKLILAK